MTTVLQHMLEHLGQISEQLNPEEQDPVAEQLQQVLDNLEQERGWKERLQDPKALPALERLIARDRSR